MESSIRALSPPAWFPDWSSDICVVIASGESATASPIESLKGKARTLVINNCFELAPWGDVLYAADGKWWDAYPKAREFAGLKVTQDAAAAKRYGLYRVHIFSEVNPASHRIAIEAPGVLGHGGNSGFQGLNLAVQFGARRILLIGFDLKGSHWHANHPEPMLNPRPQRLDKWRSRLDEQAPVFRQLGVDVINCSGVSALNRYRKMSLEEALIKWAT